MEILYIILGCILLGVVVTLFIVSQNKNSKFQFPAKVIGWTLFALMIVLFFKGLDEEQTKKCPDQDMACTEIE